MTSEYIELTYIGVGANSGAVIHTGVVLNSTTYCEIKFQYTDTPLSDRYFYGVWRSNKDSMAGVYNGKWSFTVGNTGFKNTTNWDSDIHVLKENENGILLDDVVVGSANWSNVPAFETYLFSDNGHNPVSNVHIYYAKIWQNGVLIRHFIPAQRVGDSVLGLYDDVNGTFYTNDGTGNFIGGDPVQDSYTVVFNANGGTGTMVSQTIMVDEPTALTLNAFTRDDYAFAGWATTPAGPVVYTDGEVVTNLAAADQTVTLYAVWRPAPMTMLLQTNTSEPVKVDKDVETIASVYATLREECSIIDPVFNVQMDIVDAVRCNYVTVPKFGRSYFVQEVVSVRTGLVQLSCHVDVLSSFKSQIRANSAIVHKQEGEWNLYLNDGSLRIYQDPIVITQPFPSGFSNYEYIMAIAGN